MGTHDDLIDRLTSRLRVDPELRADVAAELRAHLEDAAAEYVRGGYSDQAAAAQAVRALGDEADLARQLWQANRRRIALRRVCRWAARVLLVPGAVAVIVLVAWGLRQQRQFGSFVGSTRLLSDGVAGRMTEDERLIVLGDAGADTYVRAQRAIVDRWPDNPIYRANYVAAYVAARVRRLPRYTSGGIGPAGGVLPVWEERTPLDDVATDDPAALLAEVVAELDRAAAADPDNALYPLLRAALRVQASSEARQDGAGPEGEPLRPGVLIGDEAVFARALEDTRLAAARPHYAAHEADLARIRLEAIPKSRRLMDAVTLPLAVGNRAAQVWVATYGLQRNWARTLAAYARQLAAEGRRDEALQLNRQLRTIAAKRGAGSQTIIESLLATALYALALHNEADIH
ncbi:MAG: hypothetical protein GX591_10270, partial [Planctomycetes bacterium]|nr:hypothetical protein [Planctomycetota bacterium]